MNWKLCCSLVSFSNSVIQSVSHQTIIPQNRESHSHHTASVQNPDSALTQAIVYVCALFFSYRKIWDNTDMGPGIIQPGPSWEYQMVGLFNLLISLHKIKSEIEGTDKRQVFSLLLGAPALARNCKLPDTVFLDFQELSYPYRWGTFKQTKCDNTDREKEPKDTDKRWTLPGGAGGIVGFSSGSLRLPGWAGICYAERTRTLWVAQERVRSHGREQGESIAPGRC